VKWNPVDAKFFSVKSRELSGTDLFRVLTLCLATTALIFDAIGGRWVENLRFSLCVPLVVCALLTVALGYWVVPLLRRLKAGQVIREDGPQAHLKKGGTPTMGGVFFIPVGLLVALVWSGFSPTVVAVSLVTLGYAMIGWVDDWQILLKKSNKGISPRMKLALQFAVAIIFCVWLGMTQPANLTNIALPFGVVLPLGVLFWPLAVFVLLAQSNSTNLTDGLDGLMGGTGAIAFLGLGALLGGNFPDLMIFCAAMSGSCLGFLAYNRNPAKVFMGDTGSLGLGAGLAAVALLSNTLWSLFLISGIFFIEAISVMAQVGYYKATKRPDGIGKRLFKMAPIHHHLELSGWSELQVVAVFYIINAILVLISLVIR
jgi:phospho-N-acetylmuramoyl-pentapeptide-transferase